MPSHEENCNWPGKCACHTKWPARSASLRAQDSLDDAGSTAQPTAPRDHCTASVNPTESHVIWRDVSTELGEWALPLTAESAREIVALADKWRVRGPNGPARSIQLHGVEWASVWRAIDGGAS